ncbi:YIP1 family protein [Alkalicoccobacillus gibsonii]|uniref:YIP1 family protein n=1 Tax=Alkalicoccobacillus gibsonii TaxID=79881 RepID=UPI003F7BA074
MEEKLNPWLHIWFKPRAVIRQELEKPDREKYFILLSIVIGMLTAFTGYEQDSPVLNPLSLTLVVVFGGAAGGLFMLYFISWVNAVVGRWLGGRGYASDLRVAALRGSMVPSLLTVFIGLIDFAIRGEEFFYSVNLLIETREMSTLAFIAGGMPPALIVLQVIAFVWTFIISLKSIGEAHGFSAWMALLMYILAALLFFIPIMIISFIVSIFIFL